MTSTGDKCRGIQLRSAVQVTVFTYQFRHFRITLGLDIFNNVLDEAFRIR
jgi:hypothetical protein